MDPEAHNYLWLVCFIDHALRLERANDEFAVRSSTVSADCNLPAIPDLPLCNGNANVIDSSPFYSSQLQQEARLTARGKTRSPVAAIQLHDLLLSDIVFCLVVFAPLSSQIGTGPMCGYDDTVCTLLIYV